MSAHIQFFFLLHFDLVYSCMSIGFAHFLQGREKENEFRLRKLEVIKCLDKPKADRHIPFLVFSFHV